MPPGLDVALLLIQTSLIEIYCPVVVPVFVVCGYGLSYSATQ